MALVFALLLCLAPAARAGDSMIPMEFTSPNIAGVGVGLYPDYIGSDDYAVGAAPVVRFTFGGERFVQLVANELRVNILNHPRWRLGLEGIYRFGRDDDVEDDAVSRMTEIDDAVELGVFTSYSLIKDAADPRKQLAVSGFWAADVSDAHDGWLAGVGMQGYYPVARPLTLGAGIRAAYASDDYTQTYFGVTSVDALASGLPTYRAEEGFRDAGGWVGAVVSFSPSWHVSTMAMYSRVLEDAADSPLVTERGSEDQWVYGVGAIYAW